MGAMDLTEPQAGSDLGAIRTRATEPTDAPCSTARRSSSPTAARRCTSCSQRDDDTYDKSLGTTNGLSLYLCPRTLPDGAANGLQVVRLEQKLGIHGSPTAVIAFDEAVAWRIGEKGRGFRAMLSLMNNARLGVAAQAVGIGEAALDSAVRYARERKQFGVPIVQQPLMVNQLARMVTNLEASRALLYRTCALVDRNHSIRAYLDREKDLPSGERERYEAIFERNDVRIRLLTAAREVPRNRGLRRADARRDPGARRARLHVRIGAGKLHADAIITTIYEGTSQIQVSFALKEVGKGRARRRVRRGAPRSRQPHPARAGARTPTAFAAGSTWCSRRAARWPPIWVMRCSPRSRWPRTSRAFSSRASCCCRQPGSGAVRPRGVLDRAAHGGSRRSHRADPARLLGPDRALHADDRGGGPRLNSVTCAPHEEWRAACSSAWRRSWTSRGRGARARVLARARRVRTVARAAQPGSALRVL
jgi:alkylation response protein AidB-like acyl-CoA dehydrogenase